MKLVYDCEIFQNYFYFHFRDLDSNKEIEFSSDDKIDTRDKLNDLLKNRNELILIGYNNHYYDSLILNYLIKNISNYDIEKELYEISKNIIVNKLSSWEIKNKYKISYSNFKEFDLNSYSNFLGLKEYSVRIHNEWLESLPIDPDVKVLKEQISSLKSYCQNDTLITKNLFLNVFKDKFEAKSALIKSYKLEEKEGFQKTDRRIVEDILCGKLKKKKNSDLEEEIFYYNPPIDINFETPELKDIFETYKGIEFQKGVSFKKEISIFNNLKIIFGLGGLHASKDNYSNEKVIDIDVASYYPNIIKNYKLLPDAVLSPNIYYNMIDERIKNKKTNPQLATAQKIILNSVFGAMNYANKNVKGRLYDYKKLLTITITGQLLIAKLAEMLYLKGYDVIYINTDGLMIKDNGDNNYLNICKEWEKLYNYNLEYNNIKKIAIRDVNNYLAIGENGVLKGKGDYVRSKGSKNNAFMRIVWKAIENYIVNDTKIEDTINNSNNIEDFVLYHKYTSTFNVFLNDKKISNVVRYVLSYPNLKNNIVAKKEDGGETKRFQTNNVKLAYHLKNVDFKDINKQRYIELAYIKLEELLGEGNVSNEELLNKLEPFKKALKVDNDDVFQAAIGKINLPNNTIKSLKCKTIKLKCGSKTGYLALDIDDPNHPKAKYLRKKLNKNDLLVYSSKYTREDILKGKGRYKVIFKYHGNHIPNRKTNKHIEIFYTNSLKPVSVLGYKTDYEDYVFSGEVRELDFDLNEITESKIPFNLLGEGIKNKKKVVRKKEEVKENNMFLDDIKAINVDNNDMKTIKFVLQKLNYINIPKMEIQNPWIIFKCIFPNLHKRGNNAYAYKVEKKYIFKCQGSVCSDEYTLLTRKFNSYLLRQKKFDNLKLFKGVKENEVNLFVAPTGWGKTESIASEILNSINEGKRLLVLMPDKTAIERLLHRVKEYSKNTLKLLMDSNKILIYTSETKQNINESILLNANVIISHHYYFINSGQLLTYYPFSWRILELPELKLIIDEAHTFLEKCSRIDINIGSLYTPSIFNSSKVLKMNKKGLTYDEAKNINASLELNSLFIDKDKYNSYYFELPYRLYKKSNITYINIYDKVEKKFKKTKKWQEGHMIYRSYLNEDVWNIQPNNIEEKTQYDTIINELLLSSADGALISINKGDDNKRKKIGETILTIFHSQILKKVLLTPKTTILTSATIKEYHKNLLNKISKFNNILVNEKVSKVNKIILLWSENKINIKDDIISILEAYNTKSLLFFETIKTAKNLLHKYSHILLNDNGIYCFGNRKGINDFGDNIERNITVAGLESSVAKGYNYIEEIEKGLGFEILYFNSPPISPTRIKKYMNEEGDMVDHSSNYNMAALAQAIGRVFRKEKDNLTICLRGFSRAYYNAIVEYLKETTTAEIIEDALNITNFKISISKFKDPKNNNHLKDNFIFEKLTKQK